ncbi:MAG: acyl-CoA thioesterase [Candidatus Obscuribacterales bacterium]|nr:acyl-CoA thioesterase [Candidatus Obscuribacterales bacterium]
MSSNTDERQLTVRVTMQPRDADKHGKISGAILGHIDLAAAAKARQSCTSAKIRKVVTRLVDEIDFTEPVKIGDVLSCYSSIVRIGTTSVTVLVEVEADRDGQIIAITKANTVFVALDRAGSPTPLDSSKKLSKGVKKPAAKTTAAPSAPSAQTPSEPPAERIVALRKMMMPYELNGQGDIFGGQLMGLMVEGGTYVAGRICKNRFISGCVLRKMNKMEFKQPVNVNDVITCYGTVTEVGTTSISVHIEAEVVRNGKTIPVTQADFVFVAVNDKNKPVRVCCGRRRQK